jgi:hypothetical protein
MVELRRRVKTPLSTSRFAEVRDDATTRYARGRV